jgi:hypothetical protein
MDEVVADVVPLDVCGVILGSPYLYVRDAIFRRRENQYRLVKYGKAYFINAHKGQSQTLFDQCSSGQENHWQHKEVCLVVFERRKATRRRK